MPPKASTSVATAAAVGGKPISAAAATTATRAPSSKDQKQSQHPSGKKTTSTKKSSGNPKKSSNKDDDDDDATTGPSSKSPSSASTTRSSTSRVSSASPSTASKSGSNATSTASSRRGSVTTPSKNNINPSKLRTKNKQSSKTSDNKATSLVPTPAATATATTTTIISSNNSNNNNLSQLPPPIVTITPSSNPVFADVTSNVANNHNSTIIVNQQTHPFLQGGPHGISQSSSIYAMYPDMTRLFRILDGDRLLFYNDTNSTDFIIKVKFFEDDDDGNDVAGKDLAEKKKRADSNVLLELSAQHDPNSENNTIENLQVDPRGSAKWATEFGVEFTNNNNNKKNNEKSDSQKQHLFILDIVQPGETQVFAQGKGVEKAYAVNFSHRTHARVDPTSEPIPSLEKYKKFTFPILKDAVALRHPLSGTATKVFPVYPDGTRLFRVHDGKKIYFYNDTADKEFFVKVDFEELLVGRAVKALGSAKKVSSQLNQQQQQNNQMQNQQPLPTDSVCIDTILPGSLQPFAEAEFLMSHCTMYVMEKKLNEKTGEVFDSGLVPFDLFKFNNPSGWDKSLVGLSNNNFDVNLLPTTTTTATSSSSSSPRQPQQQHPKFVSVFPVIFGKLYRIHDGDRLFFYNDTKNEDFEISVGFPALSASSINNTASGNLNNQITQLGSAIKTKKKLHMPASTTMNNNNKQLHLLATATSTENTAEVTPRLFSASTNSNTNNSNFGGDTTDIENHPHSLHPNSLLDPHGSSTNSLSSRSNVTTGTSSAQNHHQNTNTNTSNTTLVPIVTIMDVIYAGKTQPFCKSGGGGDISQQILSVTAYKQKNSSLENDEDIITNNKENNNNSDGNSDNSSKEAKFERDGKMLRKANNNLIDAATFDFNGAGPMHLSDACHVFCMFEDNTKLFRIIDEKNKMLLFYNDTQHYDFIVKVQFKIVRKKKLSKKPTENTKPKKIEENMTKNNNASKGGVKFAIAEEDDDRNKSDDDDDDEDDEDAFNEDGSRKGNSKLQPVGTAVIVHDPGVTNISNNSSKTSVTFITIIDTIPPLTTHPIAEHVDFVDLLETGGGYKVSFAQRFSKKTNSSNNNTNNNNRGATNTSSSSSSTNNNAKNAQQQQQNSSSAESGATPAANAQVQMPTMSAITKFNLGGPFGIACPPKLITTETATERTSESNPATEENSKNNNLNNDPNQTSAKYLTFDCFDGDGMLYRIVTLPGLNKWYFYNDTVDAEMHVTVKFFGAKNLRKPSEIISGSSGGFSASSGPSPSTRVSRTAAATAALIGSSSHSVVHSSDRNGDVDLVTDIILPGETNCFVEADEITKFSCNFAAKSVSALTRKKIKEMAAPLISEDRARFAELTFSLNQEREKENKLNNQANKGNGKNSGVNNIISAATDNIITSHEQSIELCLQSSPSVSFIDVTFPPSEHSIFRPVADHTDPGFVSWIRASKSESRNNSNNFYGTSSTTSTTQLVASSSSTKYTQNNETGKVYDESNTEVVFPNSMTFVAPHFVRDSSIGNQWIACSIAILAEFPEFIRDFFNSAATRDLLLKRREQLVGVHRVSFIGKRSEWWTTDVIDDFLPCVGRRSLCGTRHRTRPAKELWVSLIEKQIAKMQGSYSAILGGDPMFIFSTLTGFPCSKFDEKDWKLRIKQQQHQGGILFEALSDAVKAQNIVMLSTKQTYFLTDAAIAVEDQIVNRALLGNTTAASSKNASAANPNGNKTASSGEANIVPTASDSVLNNITSTGLELDRSYAILEMKHFPEHDDLRLVKIRNPYFYGSERHREAIQLIVDHLRGSNGDVDGEDNNNNGGDADTARSGGSVKSSRNSSRLRRRSSLVPTSSRSISNTSHNINNGNSSNSNKNINNNPSLSFLPVYGGVTANDLIPGSPNFTTTFFDYSEDVDDEEMEEMEKEEDIQLDRVLSSGWRGPWNAWDKQWSKYPEVAQSCGVTMIYPGANASTTTTTTTVVGTNNNNNNNHADDSSKPQQKQNLGYFERQKIETAKREEKSRQLQNSKHSFWIEWNDLIKYFHSAGICYSNRNWSNFRIRSQFSSTDGTCPVALKIRVKPPSISNSGSLSQPLPLSSTALPQSGNSSGEIAARTPTPSANSDNLKKKFSVIFSINQSGLPPNASEARGGRPYLSVALALLVPAQQNPATATTTSSTNSSQTAASSPIPKYSVRTSSSKIVNLPTHHSHTSQTDRITHNSAKHVGFKLEFDQSSNNNPGEYFYVVPHCNIVLPTDDAKALSFSLCYYTEPQQQNQVDPASFLEVQFVQIQNTEKWFANDGNDAKNSNTSAFDVIATPVDEDYQVKKSNGGKPVARHGWTFDTM